MEPEGSLPSSQEPAIGPCTKPDINVGRPKESVQFRGSV
jgi:hypothetical protein